MRTCTLDDCDSPQYAKGWCCKHYFRRARHGDPSISKRSQEVQKTITAASQSSTDECILWPHRVGKDGYGTVKAGGRIFAAHRQVCKIVHGQPFEGAHAAHACGQKRCINPRHLRWATAKENVHDMFLHGTFPLGERSGTATLSGAEVADILTDTRNQSEIADSYGVSQSTVSKIKTGRRWRHVTGIDGRAGRGVNT